MSVIEQELVLFFKLYLLARKNNYINYMEQTHLLARWFDFNQAAAIEIIDAPIYCGSCFTYKGHCVGGILTVGCVICKEGSNMAYEIQQLSKILGITWYLCIYLLCKAIEDLYKANNVITFQHVIYR